ncbi:MAG TPA: hypothetical protein VL949_05180 [Geobacteraceae bacterium]|jgi:hypothetical protein|nr:hypothetical protein [Geobacteraceae bacterium]
MNKQLKKTTIFELTSVREELASMYLRIETDPLEKRAFLQDIALADERVATAISRIKMIRE